MMLTLARPLDLAPRYRRRHHPPGDHRRRPGSGCATFLPNSPGPIWPWAQDEVGDAKPPSRMSWAQGALHCRYELIRRRSD